MRLHDLSAAFFCSLALFCLLSVVLLNLPEFLLATFFAQVTVRFGHLHPQQCDIFLRDGICHVIWDVIWSLKSGCDFVNTVPRYGTEKRYGARCSCRGLAVSLHTHLPHLWYWTRKRRRWKLNLNHIFHVHQLKSKCTPPITILLFYRFLLSWSLQYTALAWLASHS